MAEREKVEEERVPAWQAYYDDIFFLFLMGAVVFVVFYTVWGLLELSNVPLWPK